MKTNSRSANSSTTERVSARERLLAAASELFYSEGINSVGIDRVIERAGVAKASLYSNFESKDDLVRAYLVQRHEARRARIEARLAKIDDPKDKLLAIFDVLGEVLKQSDFRGCAFIRAGTETRPDSSAHGICVDSRGWMRRLFRDLAKDAGAKDPSGLAAQFMLLYDGAVVAAQMDKDPSAASVAKRLAAQLFPTGG
jgi:AcrR family transcriptional regulator